MTDQQELPGMPEETPLAQVAKRYAAVKDRIAAAKLESDAIEQDVFAEMDKAGVQHFKISVGGENYEFDVKASERSLICRKITKTPKKAETTAPVETESPEPVTA